MTQSLVMLLANDFECGALTSSQALARRSGSDIAQGWPHRTAWQGFQIFWLRLRSTPSYFDAPHTAEARP
jgi:hypothetical protein